MMAELLPCPFCGGEPYRLDAAHSTAGVDTIACRSCGCRVFGGRNLEWNARAQLEAQRGGAVVVAELAEDDLHVEMQTWMAQPLEVRGPAWPGHGQYAKGFTKGFSLAVSRVQPIPADRVLADGMVGVEGETIDKLLELLNCSVGAWEDVRQARNILAATLSSAEK
jgi:hypothetical protein